MSNNQVRLCVFIDYTFLALLLQIPYNRSMRNVEACSELRKPIWEQRRVVDKKAWQTEGSQLALFNMLVGDFIASGCSIGAINDLIPLGDFVDRAFLQANLPLRQEEKLVDPVVHSYRVALRFVKGTQLDPKVLPTYAAIALLHDVVEDTHTDPEVIKKIFGEEIAQGVVLLSKKVNGVKISIERYYEELRNADPEIRWIKAADRIENLSVFLRMSYVPELIDPNQFKLPSGNSILQAMAENLMESQQHVMELAKGNPYLQKELQEVMQQIKERLIQLKAQKKVFDA